MTRRPRDPLWRSPFVPAGLGVDQAMDRHIDFEGIENFRDFGGYATRHGSTVRRQRLFRSAHHAGATEADLARLGELGIEVVMDLRRPSERRREPCRPETFARRVIASDLDDHDGWVENARAGDLDAEWFRNDCRQFYRLTPFEGRHVELFSRWFHAVAEAEGAVLVHCAAGKDRTGMICALTHHIAGVHRDDTMADYLATNDAAAIDKRVEFLGPWIHDLTGVTVDDAGLRQAVSVHEAFLAEAFSVMVERHGSVDNYLAEVLGVDTALRDRIAARILG